MSGSERSESSFDEEQTRHFQSLTDSELFQEREASKRMLQTASLITVVSVAAACASVYFDKNNMLPYVNTISPLNDKAIVGADIIMVVPFMVSAGWAMWGLNTTITSWDAFLRANKEIKERFPGRRQ